MKWKLWDLFNTRAGDRALAEFERRTGQCLEPDGQGGVRLVRKADLDGQQVSPARVRGGRVARRER